MPQRIDVIVAQYGVANDQLRAQETMPLDDTGYYIRDVRIAGDEKQGAIYATCRFE